MLLVGTAGVGIWLWQAQALDVAVFAMAVPLAWQITTAAGWVSWEVAGIFENIGVVQEGMESIAVPHRMADRPLAQPMSVPKGEIRFDQLGFAYDAGRPVLRDIDVLIRPGERVGHAEVLGVASDGDGVAPADVLAALAARGLGFVFIEGGGVTVSRFLAAGVLDRLQVTVAPMIIGSGRPALTLPEIATLDVALRPPTRVVRLGGDVLFDCVLR
jgi:hypothetical protein